MEWNELVLDFINKSKLKVVNIDYDNRKIKYDKEVMQRYWTIDSIPENDVNEEYVRAYLTTKLVNELEYNTSRIEFEKEYKTPGRKKDNKPRIDVIVKDREENIFFFIELKSPNKFEKEKYSAIEKQLFLLAKNEEKKIKYLVYYTTICKGNSLVDNAIIIDYEKYPNYELWKEAGEPSSSDELPARYEKALKEPFMKKGNKDLYKTLDLLELENMRKSLHDVLWGGGGTDDNEIFSSLVNIILAKIQDENERNNGELYQFQVFSYGEKGDEQEPSTKVFERINNLYKRALFERLNIDKEKAEESKIIDEKKFPLTKLIHTVKELEKYSFTESIAKINGTDILGNFFEGIIRDGFKQSKGQFFTPSNIVNFMIYALELDNFALKKLNNEKRFPYIIDPSAGSGTFLIEAMKVITKEIKYKRKNEVMTNSYVMDKFRELMPEYKENAWAKEYLYGIDINFNLGTAIKVNMILHGDGNTNIFVKSGLLPFRFYNNDNDEVNYLKDYRKDELYYNKDVNGKFDVIISNPPFSVDLDTETKKHLSTDFLFGDKKNSENLFVERWYQLLRERGRLGVVLPESIFDTAENKYIRLFIYKYFKVTAVISLPTVTFEDNTSTKTSILFAEKKIDKDIIKWNTIWKKYSNEWGLLNTRINNYIKVLIEGQDKSRYPSIKNDNDNKIKQNILRYLKDVIENDDRSLSNIKLLEKYKVEIENISKIDKDLVDYFGYVNCWWVFSEVSKDINYKIFMAEADNVGYKKRKNVTYKMPNDLYDIEIAPSEIKIEEILYKYNKEINNLKENLIKVKSDKLVLEEKKCKKETVKINKEIEKINRKVESIDKELKNKEKQIKNIKNIFDTYYTSDGKIKIEYWDRTDDILLDAFNYGVLKKYKSEDILIRKKANIKILDFLRSNKIWQ